MAANSFSLSYQAGVLSTPDGRRRRVDHSPQSGASGVKAGDGANHAGPSPIAACRLHDKLTPAARRGSVAARRKSCKARIMKLIFTAIVALVAVSSPASAVNIVPWGPGGVPLPGLPGFNAIATFDGVPQTPYGDSVQTPPDPATFTDGGGSWSGAGIVMNNAPGSAMGLYAEPYNDTTNYMAVLGGSSETVTYGSLKSKLGLYWGSIDTYNVLTLYNGVSSVVVPVPPIADGNQASSDSNRYFVITGFDFNKVVFSSNGNSFEFDNVATGVPEPATWVLMLIGLAGVGLAGRQRTSNRAAAAVAA
jgi:hypothetical protein